MSVERIPEPHAGNMHSTYVSAKGDTQLQPATSVVSYIKAYYYRCYPIIWDPREGKTIATIHVVT